MTEYLLYPDESYVGDIYPYAVPEVPAEASECHSPAGSLWERVGADDANSEALGNAILAIFEGSKAAGDATKISIDRLTPSNTAAEIDELVAAEIWNRAVTAETGEMMTVNVDLIGANSIRADQLEAGIMSGQTVIGSEFRTADGKVVFDSSGFRAFTSTNKLGVQITGEAATITAGTFSTPTVRNPTNGADSWSTFGTGGYFCYGDDKVRFAASAAYPLGAACWDPNSGKLQPISQFVFGPTFIQDDRWQEISSDSWCEGFTYWFTAPSSLMFAWLEFDCEFTGHVSNSSGSWTIEHADFIWDLRDESQALVETLWQKDAALAPTGMHATYNLYPHWSTCQVMPTTPGQVYKLTLWARKSGDKASSSDLSSFGYARVVLFAS